MGSIDSRGVIERNRWPEPSAKFNPKDITIRSDGAYIKLWEFFVEESGIFCAYSEGPFKEGTDPSYRKIEENIYTYVVVG